MKLSDTIYTTDQHKQSKNVFLIVLGTILFSIYAGLLIPVNNIGAGGALGLSLVINKLTLKVFWWINTKPRIPPTIFNTRKIVKKIKNGKIWRNPFLSFFLIDVITKKATSKIANKNTCTYETISQWV